ATRDSEHLPVIAQVHITATAVRALSAINSRVEGDAIACLEAADFLAYVSDNSCRFVSHHDRWNPPSGRSIETVDVAAANAAGRYSNKQFIVVECRHRNVRNFKVSVLREEQSFHGVKFTLA